MTDTKTGSALRRELERLSGRVEVLERAAAEARGERLDMEAIDEGRIDVDRAFDQLDADVQSAIEAEFGRVADELRRKIAEA